MIDKGHKDDRPDCLKEKKNSRYTVASAMNLAFTVAASLFIPVFAGIYIGEAFGNRTGGALIGSLLGLLTAFGALWELVGKKNL